MHFPAALPLKTLWHQCAHAELPRFAAAPPAPGTWGNAPRNSIRGPGQFGVNATASRVFQLIPRMSLTWSINATNIFNRITYSGIDSTVGSAQFGLPTSTNDMRRITTRVSMGF